MMNYYEEANREFEVWIETHDQHTLLASLEHLEKTGHHKLIEWLQNYILTEIG